MRISFPLLSFFGSKPKRPVRVLVDLTRLSPGGSNGGVKPGLLRQLQTIARERGSEFIFIYLVQRPMVDEIEQFRRVEDLNVCVDNPNQPTTDNCLADKANTLTLNQLGEDPITKLALDVVYAPVGFSNYAQKGIPYLALIADTLHRDLPELLPTAEVEFRERWHRKVLSECDAIQCVSQFGKQQIIHHFGTPEQKLFVTYHATECDYAKPPPFPNSSLRPYFIYPANDWPHKNHQALLKAYSLYRQKTRDEPWDLVLTGHKSSNVPWEQWLAENRLHDYVRHHQYVPSDEFRTLFQRAGALVFPSLYEGFGIPVLDAMTFGLPIACSRRASLPEVAGSAAVYFDPSNIQEIAESMCVLSQDSSLRTKLRSLGLIQAAKFSAAKESGILAENLIKLASKRHRKSAT